MDRSHNCRRIHGLGRHSSRNSEVRYLHLSIHGDQHILRLDITVNDMLFMGCFDSGGYLDRDPDGFLYIQMTFFRDIAL